MMKRKLCLGESSNKMLKLNASSLDVTYENNDRTFNFELTDKKAKSNLLKSANRPQFEAEMKQLSLNLKFSAGAYLLVAKPFIEECETYFNKNASLTKNSMEVKVNEFRVGKELNDKHVDTKIVFLVNSQKVTMHCYNSTQNIMVNGSIYVEFTEKFLDKNKAQIKDYDMTVISSLSARGRPLKARSVKNIRSVIQQVDFSCKKCCSTFSSHGQLRKHKAETHTTSLNISNNSSLSIKNSTRNDSIAGEMLLCDDITINDGPKNHINQEVLEIEYMERLRCDKCTSEFTDSKDLAAHQVTHVLHTISCRKCNFKCNQVGDLDVHMEQIHGKNQNTLNTEDGKDLIEIDKAENTQNQENAVVELTCTKCEFKTNSSTDLVNHMHEEQTIQPCLEELTCQHCSFEASSADDLKNHLKGVHHYIKCNNCDFTTQKKEELMIHTNSTHITVSVNINKIQPPNIQILSCDECEYTCTLNRQMKSHKKRKHVEDCKYKCNFCNFEANVIIAMYAHKFEAHPEIDHEFRPQTKSKTSNEFILNLLAEQNIALMEEVLNLKKDLKGFKTEIVNSVVEVKEQTEKLLMTTPPPLSPVHQPSAPPRVPEPKSTRRVITTIPPPTSSLPPSTSLPPTPPLLPTCPPRSMMSHSQESTKASTIPKTKFLMKPKLLYIGDSIAHNTDLRNLERATNTRIHSRKAYSSVKDGRARWPHKNFADVTSAALSETNDGDKFTNLILSAPSVDITNIDTSEARSVDDITWFEQDVYQSCQNMFTIAQSALESQPQIRQVIILEHAPRFDNNLDHLSLKPKLARFANKTFNELWLSSPHKERIQIGKLNMECSDDLVEARYRDERTGRFDGIHMFGMFGKRAFSRNLIRIINNNTTNYQNKTGYCSGFNPITHGGNKTNNCDQTTTQPRYHSSVQDSNRYHILSSISENH